MHEHTGHDLRLYRKMGNQLCTWLFYKSTGAYYHTSELSIYATSSPDVFIFRDPRTKETQRLRLAVHDRVRNSFKALEENSWQAKRKQERSMAEIAEELYNLEAAALSPKGKDRASNAFKKTADSKTMKKSVEEVERKASDAKRNSVVGHQRNSFREEFAASKQTYETAKEEEQASTYRYMGFEDETDENSSNSLERLVARLIMYVYESPRQSFASPTSVRQRGWQLTSPGVVLGVAGFFVFSRVPTLLPLLAQDKVSMVDRIAIDTQTGAMFAVVLAAVIQQAPLSAILAANAVERRALQIRFDAWVSFVENLLILSLSLIVLALFVFSSINYPLRFPGTVESRVVTKSVLTTFPQARNANLSGVNVTEVSERVDDVSTTIMPIPVSDFSNAGLLNFVVIAAVVLMVLYVVFRIYLSLVRKNRYKRALRENLKLLPVKENFDFSDYTWLKYLQESRMLTDLATRIDDGTLLGERNVEILEIEGVYVGTLKVLFESNVDNINPGAFKATITQEVGTQDRFTLELPTVFRDYRDVFRHHPGGGYRFQGSVFKFDRSKINYQALLANPREEGPVL